MTDDFAKYLRKQNLSDSTVKSCLYAVRQFDTQYGAPLSPRGISGQLKNSRRAITSTRMLCTRTPSAIVLPKTSWSAAAILHFSQTLWGMKILRQPEFTCGKRERNKKSW